MRRASKVLAATAALASVAGAAWGMARARPARAPGDEVVVLTGVVEAREVDLRAEVAGQVIEVRCEEGRPVASGAPLVLLDPRGPEAELVAARGALGEARARQALLAAGARAEERAEARGRLALEESRLAEAERERGRAEQLHARGVVSEDALDRARGACERARAAVDVARAALARLEAGARPEELLAAAASVEAAEGRAARAALAVERTRIVAPMTATVVRRHVEPGEALQPGALALTLARLDHLEVEVYLLEPHLGRVRPGAPVEVRADAWPGRAFPGRVTRLATEAEFTPQSLQTPEDRVKLVYAVTVVLEPTADLLPGMPVDVHVPLAAAAAVEVARDR